MDIYYTSIHSFPYVFHPIVSLNHVCKSILPQVALNVNLGQIMVYEWLSMMYALAVDYFLLT